MVNFPCSSLYACQFPKLSTLYVMKEAVGMVLFHLAENALFCQISNEMMPLVVHCD